MTRMMLSLLAAGAFAFAVSVTVSADAANADTLILAQTLQNPGGGGGGNRPTGPQNLAAPQRGAEVKCTEGQSVDDCCKGIDFCACLHDPLGGATPLACYSSPPPKPSGN